MSEPRMKRWVAAPRRKTFLPSTSRREVTTVYIENPPINTVYGRTIHLPQQAVIGQAFCPKSCEMMEKENLTITGTEKVQDRTGRVRTVDKYGWESGWNPTMSRDEQREQLEVIERGIENLIGSDPRNPREKNPTVIGDLVRRRACLIKWYGECAPEIALRTKLLDATHGDIKRVKDPIDRAYADASARYEREVEAAKRATEAAQPVRAKIPMPKDLRGAETPPWMRGLEVPSLYTRTGVRQRPKGYLTPEEWQKLRKK